MPHSMGFSVALTPFNLLMAIAGVTVGILIGALPGIGPPSGVALLLPLTFGIPEMMDGMDFLPVAIGLFGLGEVLAGAEAAAAGNPILQGRYGFRDVMPSAKDWVRSR